MYETNEVEMDHKISFVQIQYYLSKINSILKYLDEIDYFRHYNHQSFLQ